MHDDSPYYRHSGASTASGFGTLALASNAGLASLGRICAAGVAIVCLIAVLLLPVWWRALHVRTRDEPLFGPK